MATDYVPQSYPNLATWLQKQHDDTASQAASVMTAAEQTAFLAAINAILPTATTIAGLMEQLDHATADLQPLLEANLPAIRAAIKRSKTSGAYLPSLGQEMGWVGESHEIDLSTARPSITVEAQRGRIKLDGRKPGFESVNLYSRKKGEVTWKLIAIRKRKFPYYDETPLSVPGTPEVREYMAIGVIADEEAGQPSEIKEVVYAG